MVKEEIKNLGAVGKAGPWGVCPNCHKSDNIYYDADADLTICLNCGHCSTKDLLKHYADKEMSAEEAFMVTNQIVEANTRFEAENFIKKINFKIKDACNEGKYQALWILSGHINKICLNLVIAHFEKLGYDIRFIDKLEAPNCLDPHLIISWNQKYIKSF